MQSGTPQLPRFGPALAFPRLRDGQRGIGQSSEKLARRFCSQNGAVAYKSIRGSAEFGDRRAVVARRLQLRICS